MSDCDQIVEAGARTACRAQEDKIAALTKTIEDLQEEMEPFTSGTLNALLERLPSVAGAAIAFSAALLAIGGTAALAHAYWTGNLKLKSADLNVAGNSISFEKVTGKINQMFADVQDYVISLAAFKRDLEGAMMAVQTASEANKGAGAAPLTDASGMLLLNKRLEEKRTGSIARARNERLEAMTSDTSFKGNPPQAPNLPEVSILWVSDDSDTLIFEQEVLKKMNAKITSVGSNDEAVALLQRNYSFDLVISDMFRKEESHLAGLNLYAVLKKGVKRKWDKVPVKLGPSLRFAVYTLPKRVKRYEKNFKDDPDALITSDFAYLRARIAWLQHNKA